MKKKTILLVINFLVKGGGPSVVLRLANALSKKYNVILYSLEYPTVQGDFSDEIKNDILKLFRKKPEFQVRKFSRMKYLSFLNNLLFQRCMILYKITNYILDYFRISAIKGILNEYKVDLINSHLLASDTICAQTLLKNNYDIPFVITMHGSYENTNFKNIKKRELTLNRANSIIYLTDNNLKIFEKINFKNLQCHFIKIYNGFSDDFIYPTSDDQKIEKLKTDTEGSFVFIMVSRDGKEKGWQEAIEAFLLIEKIRIKEVKLILIGNGPFLTSLKSKYSHHKDIVFYGSSDNPISILKYGNVGLLPSYFESLPTVIVEYLYCNLPVISTNVGEVKQMLKNGDHSSGQIVDLDMEMKPNIHDLSYAMSNYLNNLDFYNLHKKNTKICFEKFSMDITFDKYSNVFDKLIINN